MIKSFRHAGIEKFFNTGSKAGIQPHHASKLEEQLTFLNMARKLSDMDIAGWDFHPLRHDLKEHYAVKVNRMWRLTFSWENGNAILVDYQDYHEG